MKTHNHLYAEICSFQNLHAAFRLAERGKKMRDTVSRFRTHLERELLQLQQELTDRTYRPGPYREKWIVRPKARQISAAPFRDRVVHHAVCRVVMPLFERKMIDDLYSNRKGKGTHAAILRCQHYLRRHPYVLKCDVRKFFPSMDHEILKGEFRRTIRCAGTLWLLDCIVDGSNAQEPVWNVFPGDDLGQAGQRRVGLPIGNVTSQWFGCIYLNRFDHWMKEELHCPGYVRYVDDFLAFGESKATLLAWKAAVAEKLAEFRLRLHERKTRAYPTAQGVTYLGQRVWPGRRRLCRENVSAARRRLRWHVRQYRSGQLTREQLLARWHSWRGHAAQADSEALVERVRKELRETLGATGK